MLMLCQATIWNSFNRQILQCLCNYTDNTLRNTELTELSFYLNPTGNQRATYYSAYLIEKCIFKLFRINSIFRFLYRVFIGGLSYVQEHLIAESNHLHSQLWWEGFNNFPQSWCFFTWGKLSGFRYIFLKFIEIILSLNSPFSYWRLFSYKVEDEYCSNRVIACVNTITWLSLLRDILISKPEWSYGLYSERT